VAEGEAHGGGGGGEHGGGGVIRELLAIFGIGVDTKELQEGESKIEHFLQHLKRASAAVAGAFIAKEIYEFAEANVKAMTEIERSSSRLGVSTERIQEYQFASEQLGLSSENLINLIGRMQVSQEAAAKGTGQQAQAFQQLGVHVRDASGKMKSADELFLDVADGISKVKDPSKAAAASVAIFGRAGREILPFLKEGRKGFEELTAEFKELGGGYSEKAIEKAKEQEKQAAKLNLAWKSLKGTLASAALPILTKVVKVGMQVVNWFRKMSENSYIVEAALGTLGAAASIFAIKMALANLPLLATVAAIAALILIVDDLITMFAGGESEIGDLIDKLLGEGAHVELVKDIRDVWREVTATFKELRPVVDDLYQSFKGIWDIVATAGKGLSWLGGTLGDELAKAMNYAKENQGRGYGKPVYRTRNNWKPAFEEQPLPGPMSNPSPPMSFMPTRGSMGSMSTPTGEYDMSSQDTYNVTVVQQPGQNGKQLAEDMLKHVNEARKQERRAAAATFQRAPQ
jgi:hypothetical protein